MRCMTSLAFFFWQILTPASVFAEPISITTFNVKFYGSSQVADPRDSNIRDFFSLEGIDADVYAFEEIIDVNGLEKNLLQNRYKCHSYNHNNRGHQHVVICVRHGLTFKIAYDDDNYAYENVALARLRPAVHGILVNAHGRELAHIVAVHLKAMPNDSPIRIEQVRLLAENLSNRGDELPLILLGDLNSYGNDIETFTGLFDESGVNLWPLEMPYYTYRTSRYKSVFDWVMVSNSIEQLAPVKVSGPCNDSWESGTAFDNLSYFNQNVSDHCPVSTVLDL